MDNKVEKLTEAKSIILKRDLSKLERKLNRGINKATNISKYATANSIKMNIEGFLYLQLITSAIALCTGVISCLLGFGLGCVVPDTDMYTGSDLGLVLIYTMMAIIITLIVAGIVSIVAGVVFPVVTIFFSKRVLLKLLEMELSEIENTKENISQLLIEQEKVMNDGKVFAIFNGVEYEFKNDTKLSQSLARGSDSKGVSKKDNGMYYAYEIGKEDRYK